MALGLLRFGDKSSPNGVVGAVGGVKYRPPVREAVGVRAGVTPFGTFVQPVSRPLMGGFETGEAFLVGS